jgi:hypothetical protein
MEMPVVCRLRLHIPVSWAGVSCRYVTINDNMPVPMNQENMSFLLASESSLRYVRELQSKFT